MCTLSVVIPVYNEKDTILEIVSQVEAALSGLDGEIIIVDDCSTDGTGKILRDLAKRKPECTIMFKEKNSGKGATLRQGFKLTRCDYVIVQDADLEYDPRDYKKLLGELEKSGVDVVYGSRFNGSYKDMTSLHFIGNKFLTLLTNLLFGVGLTDMETCYKLLPGKFVRSIDIKSDRFNFEPEITAKILKSGMTISEVPINYEGRSFSEGKKITWKDGISALATLVKYRFVD